MKALEKFAGTWKLVSLESRSEDEVFQPLGQDCRGILFLDARGVLSVQLMDPMRPNFASGDNVNGTDDEIRAAYQGFLASWGRYSVDEAEGKLRYRVEGSLFPNWVGTDQERSYKLEDDRLTFTTPQTVVRGKPTVSVLIWERDARDANACP